MQILKWILGALLLVGFIKGLTHWNDDHNGHGIARLAMSIVNGMADVTYRLLPGAVHLLNSLINSVT